jgi:beta-lactamase class A
MIATILLAAATFVLPPQQSDAVIGAVGVHLETGRRVSVRGNERFPMGSVYKFPIALAVLRRVDTGTLSLKHVVTIEPREFAPGWSPLRDGANGEPISLTVRELLRHMVAVSDNTASDALLRLIGGPRAVTTRMAELGFAGIRIDRSETEMARDLRAPGGVERYAIDARDTATPHDMAELLIAFWKGRDGLTRESHDHLVRLMTDTQTGKRRLKAAMPAGSTIAHKTGTMPGTVNDAGIVVVDGQTYAIAVFTKKGTTKEAVREDDLAAVAKAVFDALKAH